jgi:hypothetical protein
MATSSGAIHIAPVPFSFSWPALAATASTTSVTTGMKTLRFPDFTVKS